MTIKNLRYYKFNIYTKIKFFIVIIKNLRYYKFNIKFIQKLSKLIYYI